MTFLAISGISIFFLSGKLIEEVIDFFFIATEYLMIVL